MGVASSLALTYTVFSPMGRISLKKSSYSSIEETKLGNSTTTIKTNGSVELRDVT